MQLPMAPAPETPHASPFAPLQARWMDELFHGPLPPERLATCNDCVKLQKPGRAARSRGVQPRHQVLHLSADAAQLPRRRDARRRLARLRDRQSDRAGAHRSRRGGDTARPLRDRGVPRPLRHAARGSGGTARCAVRTICTSRAASVASGATANRPARPGSANTSAASWARISGSAAWRRSCAPPSSRSPCTARSSWARTRTILAAGKDSPRELYRETTKLVSELPWAEVEKIGGVEVKRLARGIARAAFARPHRVARVRAHIRASGKTGQIRGDMDRETVDRHLRRHRGWRRRVRRARPVHALQLGG